MPHRALPPRGCYSFAELLAAQLERSERIKGRPGFWTADAFAEARRPATVGLRGSLEAAWRAQHPQVRAQVSKVGEDLAGVSVFVMPKLLRFIARSGIKGLKQVDCVNSHYQMTYELASELKYLGNLPTVCRVVEQREEVLASLVTYFGRLGMQRADVKRLLLAVLFGGTYTNYTEGMRNDFLRALSKEVRAFAAKVSELHPEVYTKMKEVFHKPMPEMSTLSYVAIDRQRRHVDAMKETVTEGTICSEERDGFVVYDPDDKITAGGSVGSASAQSLISLSSS